MVTMSFSELGNVLLDRMRRAGLKFRTGARRIPSLPQGIEVGVDGLEVHDCGRHPAVEISAALVADVEIPAVDFDGKTVAIVKTAEPFEPYWLLGVRVIHDWVAYPAEANRPVTPIEAACLFAQNQALGSVQSHEGEFWGHRRIQAFRWPESDRVVLATWGMPAYNHHVARVRSLVGLDFPGLRAAFELTARPEEPPAVEKAADAPPAP